jgi:hypothetical protein
MRGVEGKNEGSGMPAQEARGQGVARAHRTTSCIMVKSVLYGERWVSPQAELALRVLKLLADGQQLSAADAVQLRMWAVRPEDTALPLEDIAKTILDEESKQKGSSDS